MDKPHPKPCSKSKTGDISKQSPSPLHHTFSLGRTRLTAQSLFALALLSGKAALPNLLTVSLPSPAYTTYHAENRHATQAIAISTELAWFVALFRFSVRYFCIFSLFSINLFFRSNIILYIFVCGGKGAKRGNFSVLIWILIYSNRTRPGVTQTTLNAWLHLIPRLLTIEWLRNISNFYKLLPTTKDKTL